MEDVKMKKKRKKVNKDKIQQMKDDIIEHINNIPFEQLHKELTEAGLQTYQDTENVVSTEINSPFGFVVWKGWVTEINDDGTYDVELIDMVRLGTHEQATISTDEILGEPEIKLGSVFMWVMITDPIEAQSIQFQKDDSEPDPELYEEVAQRASEFAKKLKEENNE